jgi:hypothetical protein
MCTLHSRLTLSDARNTPNLENLGHSSRNFCLDCLSDSLCGSRIKHTWRGKTRKPRLGKMLPYWRRILHHIYGNRRRGSGHQQLPYCGPFDSYCTLTQALKTTKTNPKLTLKSHLPYYVDLYLDTGVRPRALFHILTWILRSAMDPAWHATSIQILTVWRVQRRSIVRQNRNPWVGRRDGSMMFGTALNL